MAHITTESQILAQRHYKGWRHDQVAKVVHWKLCMRAGIPSEDSWCERTPERVIETDEFKLSSDFSIQTDDKLDDNRPDTVVVSAVRRHVCW